MFSYISYIIICTFDFNEFKEQVTVGTRQLVVVYYETTKHYLVVGFNVVE